MDVDEQRIRWALEFRTTDLKTIALAALRSNLLRFFERPGTTVGKSFFAIAMPLEHPLPQNFALKDFSRLQEDVRTLFDYLHADIYSPPLPFQIGIVLTEMVAVGAILQVTGPTRDCALFLIYMAIINKPAGTISRCQEKQCRQPFYRYRRQRFCSTTCTNRAMQRTYREAHPERAAEQQRKKQRKKYEAKAKLKLGKNVKITRREGGAR